MRYSRIDYPRLVQLLLPTFMRKPVQLRWLDCLTAPLRSLYGGTLYRVQHDGSTIYLEKVLNEGLGAEGYDPTAHEGTKKVRITDNYVPGTQWLYLEMEAKPLPSAFALFTGAEIDDPHGFYADFTVHLPKGLAGAGDDAVAHLVDTYKLAGKDYKINIE